LSVNLGLSQSRPILRRRGIGPQRERTFSARRLLVEHLLQIRQLGGSFNLGMRGKYLLGQRGARARQANQEDHLLALLHILGAG
jgi:hypothetical protein